MKTWLQCLAYVIVFCEICLVCGCHRNIEEVKIENSTAQQTLLIGLIEGRSSDFKEAIIQGLVERYAPTCAITVLNVKNVEQVAQAAYTALVIIDRNEMGMEHNDTVKAIIEQVNPNSLVVFVTSGAPWNYHGVDAMTSASEKGKEQAILQQIAAKIDAIFKQ
ncbi:hypothetical protein U27_03962 [Candidatus Vecturithrix granuli]|uniref:Response regulatory domain-containing protein n=1 Tax=Vecturithrix granuli TaxID=1499967 RepID=A0A081BXE3_VECG1|nr:hypothetical protein U27_03962 [Candidatus Vecturithrix granuli]